MRCTYFASHIKELRAREQAHCGDRHERDENSREQRSRFEKAGGRDCRVPNSSKRAHRPSWRVWDVVDRNSRREEGKR